MCTHHEGIWHNEIIAQYMFFPLLGYYAVSQKREDLIYPVTEA
jgi:hypothetical protein